MSSIKQRMDRCALMPFSIFLVFFACNVVLALEGEYIYTIKIWTGSRDYAGTDARVYITMYGYGGDSGELRLNTPWDSFEKGSVETVTLKLTSNLRMLTRIKIRHDNGKFNPGWFIDKVHIKDSEGRIFYFPCHTWLDTDVGDGKIERTLYPKITGHCGIRGAVPRLAGAKYAAKNSWPWQAVIKYRHDYLCGGTLLQPQWVITTASSLYKNTNGSNYFIILGEYELEDDEDEEQHFVAEKIVIHPKFNPQTLENDLALVKLSRPAMLTHAVNLACLPPKNYKLFPGNKCFTSGFGATDDDESFSHYLKENRLSVLPAEQCLADAISSGQNVTFDEKTMFCAGNKKTAMCHGDEGNPLVCIAIDNRYYIQGVHSWSSQPCVLSKPSYFLRIPSYMTWIESTMFVE